MPDESARAKDSAEAFFFEGANIFGHVDYTVQRFWTFFHTLNNENLFRWVYIRRIRIQSDK